MTNIGKKLASTPYGDPYWDMVGMQDGKKVVGHQLTDEEWEEYQKSLFCFSPWIMDWDKKIAWRYQGE